MTLETRAREIVLAVYRPGHGHAAWRGRDWRTACRLDAAMHAGADWDLAIGYAKGTMTVQQLIDQLKSCANKRAQVQLLGSGSIRSIVAVGIIAENGKSSIAALRLVGDEAGCLDDPAQSE